MKQKFLNGKVVRRRLCSDRSAQTKAQKWSQYCCYYLLCCFTKSPRRLSKNNQTISSNLPAISFKIWKTWLEASCRIGWTDWKTNVKLSNKSCKTYCVNCWNLSKFTKFVLKSQRRKERTISQWSVWGNMSTGTAFLKSNGSLFNLLLGFWQRSTKLFMAGPSAWHEMYTKWRTRSLSLNNRMTRSPKQ